MFNVSGKNKPYSPMNSHECIKAALVRRNFMLANNRCAFKSDCVEFSTG